MMKISKARRATMVTLVGFFVCLAPMSNFVASSNEFGAMAQSSQPSILNHPPHGKSPLNTGQSPYTKRKYKKPHHFFKKLFSWL